MWSGIFTGNIRGKVLDASNTILISTQCFLCDLQIFCLHVSLILHKMRTTTNNVDRNDFFNLFEPPTFHAAVMLMSWVWPVLETRWDVSTVSTVVCCHCMMLSQQCSLTHWPPAVSSVSCTLRNYWKHQDFYSLQYSQNINQKVL